MADIQKELNNLMQALYGSEVRQSIHDALKAGNDEIEAYTGAEEERRTAEQTRKTNETARQQAETQRQAVNAQVKELIDGFTGSMVIANTTTPGMVKAGGDISVTADGTVSIKKEVITNTIQSTVATASAPGSVKSAGDIAVAADGTVSVKESVINNLITTAFKRIYPVGKIEITYSNINPSAYLGFGTWEQFAKGQTLIGVNSTDADFNAAGKSGGSKSHKLTISEMPKHGHILSYGVDTSHPGYSVTVMANTVNSSASPILETGGDQPHNNLPPYTTVYFWRRTA